MRTNVDGLTSEELRASRNAWWTGDFDSFLLAAFPGGLPERVLDVGCGIGTLEERLAARGRARTRFVGADLDVPRLRMARRGSPREASATASFLAADGAGLPFPDGSFGASVTILTLQHVPDAGRVLSEMRRSTRPGGVVVAVEPDNLGQRLHVPCRSEKLDAALAAFWRRVRVAHLPADIAIGPRLPGLFESAGLPAPTLRGYLVVRESESDFPVFRAGTKDRFLRLALAHGVAETAEAAALLEAVDALEPAAGGTFRTVSSVPLFLASAPA